MSLNNWKMLEKLVLVFGWNEGENGFQTGENGILWHIGTQGGMRWFIKWNIQQNDRKRFLRWYKKREGGEGWCSDIISLN